MGTKGHTSALWHHGFRPRRLARRIVLAAAVALLGFCAPLVPALAARAATSPTTPIWSTQLDFDNNGTAWSESFFAGLASDGLTTAELNMPWGTIEPQAGTFTFAELDTELANASAAGIQLIPIFWQAGWGGSPAPWITGFEAGSGGAQGQAPAWWDPTEQSEYFTYVEDTIQNAVAQPGGYGGAVLDYGFLDAQWDLNGAGGGYAANDISEFRGTYLPQAYGTIATFNADNGTSYSAFTQVPAAAPGQALFGVFQAFRAWSVKTTYGQLTAAVRNVTASTPLYYYFGGGFGNATSYANNPDTFFQLAKQYNVTVIDDDASSQGLTLTFGSLARAYGVKVAQEWTAPPDNSQLAAKAASWLSLYAMGLPNGGGEDFFIHDGTTKDTVGFPIYTSWLSHLKGLSGTYPQQPAAVYIDFSQGYGNMSGGSLDNVENEIGNLWLNYQAGFSVVTSQEVNNGAVKLSSFKAVLPLNGVDANLTAYQSGGGTLLTQPEQLTQYTTPYAEIDAPDVGNLQAVPAVAAGGASASITLANITSGTAYSDPIAFSPAGLGLGSGSYYLVNAATGAAVPQAQQSNGLLCATASIGAATLAQWNVVAGTPPSGTASSSCPVTQTGATSVTATAGQSGGGMQFLDVGQSNQGSDGNLTQVTQGGEPAVETWTSSQSGAGDANVYLQLNPLSAVDAASSVTVQVTYWATSGQGFAVQYDAPGNAYANGPAVTSPGSGTWTTATVQLTGAQFTEAQNDSADLRLNVTNPGTPLIVHSVTMSVTAGTGTTPTTNLALGKTATASSSYQGYIASNVTDGNTSSYWESADGAGYPQAITVDLGSAQSIGSLTLALPPSSAWSTRTETLSVLGSTNGTSFSQIAGSAGYTFNPSTGNTATISLPSGTSARYVQLSFTANTGWPAAQLSELEVFPGSGGGGTSSPLSASPSSLSFGGTSVGSTSATQTVTVSNPNGSAVSVTSVSASGPFSQASTCGASIAAGGSCTVSVTFAPTAAGSASGTLSVSGSAPGSPLTVALSGTGVTSTTNLALNKPASASGYTQAYVPGNAVDGNTSSYWESTDNAFPQWLQVDLGSATVVGRIVMDLPPATSWGTRTQTITIQGSTDGTTYTTLAGSAGYTFNPSSGNTVTVTFSATSIRYLKLTFTANTGWPAGQLSELQAYAS
jgi:hypothetical protein